MTAGPAGLLDTTDPSRQRASQRVTWTSVVLNTGLSAAQIVIGVLGQSQALVADGVHTLSDLATDGLVLFALKHSAKEADDEHPYGHGRIETAATLALGVILLGVAAGIAWRAAERLLFDAAPPAVPSQLTLWVAVATLFAKEGLYRYTLRTADRYGSAMLRANAWHHRSDAISSLIVVAGIGGALLGFGYLDGIAAVAVALMIARIGIDLGWQALRELIDTALDPEERSAIERVIRDVNGVRALHLLRTRRMAGRAFVDVHIQVDPRASVSEGHHIGEVVRQRLIREIDPVAEVMVHIDTEEDDAGDLDTDLPLRHELESRLERLFAHIPQARLIERVVLHYGRGRVDVELTLPLAAVAASDDGRALARRFAEAVQPDPRIGKLDVYFH